MKEYEAFPLSWPPGFRRTPQREDSKFHRRVETDGGWKRKVDITLRQARDELRRQIGLLKAEDLVISTNMKTTNDGEVYSNAKEPSDPGVAIYFRFKGGHRCLAADKFSTVRENTMALARTIERMRDIERYGASEMLDRMFTGFKMLPAPASVPWWAVLRVDRHADLPVVRAAYRALLMEAHPDRAGKKADLAGQLLVEEAWLAFKNERGIG